MTDNPIDLDDWEGATADQQLDEHPENCDCIVCTMQDAPPATAIPPAREVTWRVEFLDFRDYHDFIGPTRPKRGGVLKFNRRKLPQKEHRDFLSRAAAHEFAELLRAGYGGEIACVIVHEADSHQLRQRGLLFVEGEFALPFLIAPVVRELVVEAAEVGIL